MSDSRLPDGDTMTSAERGREFWRRTLLAGSCTALPRWTPDPVAGLPAGAQPSPEMGAKVGVGEHDTRIPDDLVAALRRLADSLAVPLSTVLLTAHAKVLAALSGECEVSTGYVVTKGQSPLLCRLTTEPRSWRAMLLETNRAELELLSHAESPVDDKARLLGLRPLRGWTWPARSRSR